MKLLEFYKNELDKIKKKRLGFENIRLEDWIVDASSVQVNHYNFMLKTSYAENF